MENMEQNDHINVPAEGAGVRKASRGVRLLKRAILILLALLILAAIVFGVDLYRQLKSPDAELDPALRSRIMSLVESTELMQQAKKLKADYLALARAIMDRDIPRTAELQTAVDEDILAMELSLDTPLIQAAGNSAALRDEIASAKELLAIAKEAKQKLIDPMVELREDCPLSSLRTEGGFRVDLAMRYLDFAEAAFPVAEDLSARLDKVDRRVLKLADPEGKILQYAEKLSQLMEKAAPYRELLPFARSFLGAGEDRIYVFAAQNTAEIRASGGFPGSVGVIVIKDGVLSIEDFRSVYQVFPFGTPPSVTITPTEDELFDGRMDLAWDADFSPDFERVAEIWAAAYESRTGVAADGVVSATPVIIQRLLSFLGEITLSDGSVLNGENAMRVLGHDLYYKYLSAKPEVWVKDANGETDKLFAETARKTLALLFSTVSVQHLSDYHAFLEQSFSDRSLMLWMAREDEQETVRRMGWAGTLNRDETKPQLGVFFNSTEASKMGWFLDIDVSIGEGSAHEDGTVSYPVTVRFSNRITRSERLDGGLYIIGLSHGGIKGGLYLFAPAGGSVDNCTTSKGRLFSGEYRGLPLVYQNVVISPDESLVIECEVTCSAAAEAPLSFMQTPTARDFRG